MKTIESEVKSDIQLTDEERQPVECWTRMCYGVFSSIKSF